MRERLDAGRSSKLRNNAMNVELRRRCCNSCYCCCWHKQCS